jgi:hypothetical protein
MADAQAEDAVEGVVPVKHQHADPGLGQGAGPLMTPSSRTSFNVPIVRLLARTRSLPIVAMLPLKLVIVGLTPARLVRARALPVSVTSPAPNCRALTAKLPARSLSAVYAASSLKFRM